MKLSAYLSMVAVTAIAIGLSGCNPRAEAQNKPEATPSTTTRTAGINPATRPAYDLGTDLTARKGVARRALGSKVKLAVVENVFLVVGAPPMSQRLFQRSLSLIRRATAAYFNNRFRRRPSRAVSIYLFPAKGSYSRYCKKHYGGCGTPFGVYYGSDRRIVMNVRPGLGTLTHELIHPIMATDFPKAPDWIDEGIASLFERPTIPRAGEIHGATNWRKPRLTRALRSKSGRKLASLNRLFGMSDSVFRGKNEDLHYATARYFCQWMDSKGLLWRFYQRWRDNYKNDPTGIKAFTRVVGKSPKAANASWVRWVRAL